jgi:hypothetical protein
MQARVTDKKLHRDVAEVVYNMEIILSIAVEWTQSTVEWLTVLKLEEMEEAERKYAQNLQTQK